MATTYTAKKLRTAVFRDEKSDQTLTIVASQGKKGINLKASVKLGKGKGQPKAVTGAREVVQTDQEAIERFEAMVAAATKEGWMRVPRTTKNAFTNIPKPNATPFVEQPAHKGRKSA